MYIDEHEISRDDLRRLVDKSYGSFRHPEVTPLRQLNSKLFVLELFHGPTFAFKDVALQLLGNLFEFFLLRRNAGKKEGEQREKLTVVGATSGDTGRYVAYFTLNRMTADHMLLCQCSDLWTQGKGGHFYIHPASERARVAHSGSPNDDSDRLQRT